MVKSYVNAIRSKGRTYHYARLTRPHGRVQPSNHDRWFTVQLYRWFPSILKALMIVRPEALKFLNAPSLVA